MTAPLYRLYIPFILIGLSFVLIFKNLGNMILWVDEAEVVLEARSIATHYVPRHFDGKHIIKNALYEYKLPEHLRETQHGWLQYYVAFASTKLFGENAFAARLPFACFGFLSVILFYIFLRRNFDNYLFINIALLLYISCIPLLLHFRQCRYHALAVFFAIAAIDAYLCLLKGKKYSFVYFVLANIFLFNAHYGPGISFLFVFTLHIALIVKPGKGILKKYAAASGIIILCHIPMIWYAYQALWNMSGLEYSYSSHRGLLFEDYVLDYINAYLFPLLLAACYAVFQWRDKKRLCGINKYQSLFLLLIAGHLMALIYSRYFAHFRNLVPIIPPLLIILAQFFAYILSRRLWVGVMIMGLYLTTNVFALPVELVMKYVWLKRNEDIEESKKKELWQYALRHNQHIRFDLANYLYEITHDYAGPTKHVIDYLKAHAHPDDVVVTNSEDLPLMLYTDLRILGGQAEVGLVNLKEYARLGYPLSDKLPDWVIPRGDEGEEYFKTLLENYTYRKISLNVTDRQWENRPDPSWHLYKTKTDRKRLNIYKLSE